MKGDCKPPKQLESELFAPTKNPCIYVFMNKALGMSPGKLTAQGVHAAIMSVIDAHDSARSFWKNAMHRTVLIMQARDETHLKDIQAYLKERKFKTYLIIDEGVNEIDPHVATALATGILNKDDEDVKAALSTFSLYREKIKIVAEIEL